MCIADPFSNFHRCTSRLQKLVALDLFGSSVHIVLTGFEAILRLPQADSTLNHRIDVLPIRTRMNRIKDTRPMRPTAQSNYLVGLRETHAWRKRCEQNQNIMEHGFLNKLQLCSHTWHHAPRSSWLCLIRQTIQPKCRASPRPNP